MAVSGPVVCFGEILLRFSAPPGELLLQSPQLRVHVGGAEANVAVSLARLGVDARMVSAVPDNALGRAALGELRRWGVDVSGVRHAPGRMGLYFLTPAAGSRPYDVLYDRAAAAFAAADPDAWDWDQVLGGVAWLHLSGVTPALGPGGAAAAMNAVAAARARGVRVSFDGNYRARLWSQWDGDPPSILGGLLGGADLAFVNERDLELVLKENFSTLAPAARLPAAASAAFEAFPSLGRIATTQRLESRALVGVMIGRDGGAVQSRPYGLDGAVDRIGAGDAFAAGLLDALLRDQPPAAAIEFAAAAACLKHGIHGDFNLASRDDIDSLVMGETADVRR